MNPRNASLFADAGDDGIQFILPSPENDYTVGGLTREPDQGHLVTFAGRGGTGKSVLALQFLTNLLRQSEERNKGVKNWTQAAFYFTLEASPLELVQQLQKFKFGKRYFFPDLDEDSLEPNPDNPNADALTWKHEKGLYIQAIPSPIEDLTVLIRQVRQTIAEIHVKQPLNELVGIVIDPLGGVRSRDTLRTDLSGLKHLADSHKTFLFLLAEDHIYEQHRSIEHYSQTVLQLQYNPSSQPSRWIVVQKARNQRFRAGRHQLDLRKSGVTIFPSVEAQSAYAHDRKRETAKEIHSTEPGLEKSSPFLKVPGFSKLDEIKDGSVFFLMGPPGTFKQFMACNFTLAPGNVSSLYISFKAEKSAVEGIISRDRVRDARSIIESIRQGVATTPGKQITWFIDARDPLSTPQEILSDVRLLIEFMNRKLEQNASKESSPKTIRRAVVWGLRRLADMPNFSGSIAVHFLEALVTLLQAERITCLLVDWPDIEKGNTLPIVDLSQYILLTRLCHSRNYLLEKRIEANDSFSQKLREKVANRVWGESVKDSLQNSVLLRIQREGGVFHRDVGYLFLKSAEKKPQIKEILPEFDTKENVRLDFETCWDVAGDKWEKDPGLS